MSRIESGFVPLPKVEKEQPEENVFVRLNLPENVDQDKIGVNLSRIVSFSKISGIKNVVILGRKDMESDNVVPMVSGIGKDGSATVAKVIVKTESDDPDYINYRNFGMHEKIADRWVWANIDLNLKKIGEDVSRKNGGVRSSSNWAKELDASLKPAFRKAGTENLIKDLGRGDWLSLKIDATVFSAFSIPYLLSGDPATDFVPFLLGTIYGANHLLLEYARSKDCDVVHRLSLFPVVQLDRAAALQVLSRTKPIIKDLEGK